MKRLTLKYFDAKQEFQENANFLKRLISNSLEGLFVSILFIGTLIGLDYLARELVISLCNSNKNYLNSVADIIHRINNIIGIKFLDYFKDVIVIVAGVLGVILGLFFTTFLNIITTKYANINSAIINQVLKQKTINRYFKLLAVLVSSAVIFQFLLITGYYPTFISAFIFSICVVFTIISFPYFGKSTLIYFNAGTLVFDLIEENNNILNRAYKNKKFFNRSDYKLAVLPKIKGNIEKIKLIVDESSKPNMSNTALDSISSELLSFSINYNAYKHVIPSNNNWHLKIQKNKKWDEASSVEYQINNKAGNFLIPQTIDDYNNIEKLISETQFFIFKQSVSVNKKLDLLYNQSRYLQIIAFQSDIEIFEDYFHNLESYILLQITDASSVSSDERIQFISLFVNLIVQYLVGFNHNFQNIVKIDQLKKLAKNIHEFKDTDSVMNMPYAIRIWLDKYQEKLLNEKYTEGKIITPVFFTEYELAFQFHFVFKTHIENISQFIFKEIPKVSKRLKESKLLIEALELNSESLELHQKIEYFSENIEKRIVEINQLNLPKESSFDFKERNELLIKNNVFREKLIKEMWDLGTSSYLLDSKVLPDIYGNFYHFISSDILDKALKQNPKELAEYLPKFYTYNVLYIESLREKIDSKRFEYTASKLFPIIVDLFEISAIAILMWKALDDKEIEDSFFDFWANAFGGDPIKEAEFWKMVFPLFQYFNQPLMGMSTPSYVKEHDRRMRLDDFLKKSSLVTLKNGDGGLIPSFIQYYATEIEDIYFKDVVRILSADGIGGLGSDDISDVFIEYFLRTRIALKELKIEETRYGYNLRRYLDKDSE